jgi:hypothetical protein
MPMNLCTELRITFNILGDDKEHQDAISAKVTDTRERILFNHEIVPSTNYEGSNNEYYWRSSGDGMHPHSLDLVLTPSVPVEELIGARLDVWSSNGDGHNGDFESWTASVSLSGILDSNRTVPLKLNAQTSVVMDWRNMDNHVTRSATISTV